MKHSTSVLLASLLLLSGCAHHYVMRLTNGAEITTPGKPKLKDGVYSFKDAKGEEHLISAASVREIAPASIAKEESKTRPMKMEPAKKKKWYFLWLA